MQTKTKTVQLYSEEAEQSLLGQIFLASKTNAEIIDDIFTNVKEDYFGGQANRTIYTVMKALNKKGVDIDYVTASDSLERIGAFGNNGIDITFLTNLTNYSKNCLDYKNHIKIIFDYYNLRKLKEIGEFIEASVGDKTPAEKVKKEVDAKLDALEMETHQGNQIEHVGPSVEKEVERIESIIAGKYDDFGLPTGFPILDKTLWGLQKSDLIILGARAGVGKTAFALNVLDNISNNKRKKCLFFSLEMPKNQIAQRLFSLTAEIPNYDIKKAKGLENKLEKIREIEKRMKDGSLYIDDTSDNTVANMALKAKQMQRKEGLDLIVVDYLQFVKASQKTNDRFQDVGEIARSLKVMARQLNVPVIALCQLNRKLDNENRTPTLADLRESGEIENNADIIMFLHSTDSKFKAIRNIDLIIGKFRNGQMKAIKMQYEGNIFKFRELEKESSESFQQKMNLKNNETALTPIDDDSLPF